MLTGPVEIPPVSLPRSLPQAALRAALKARCPRCGEAPLFRKWLKPVDTCRSCGQDWTLQSADDFPAYISIFLTGHLMAPLIILLVSDVGLSIMAMLAILLPLAVATMLAVLQPAKGAIIAMQYWLGLNGFVKERRPGANGSDAL